MQRALIGIGRFLHILYDIILEAGLESIWNVARCIFHSVLRNAGENSWLRGGKEAER